MPLAGKKHALALNPELKVYFLHNFARNSFITFKNSQLC
jgi:hypothetical protein